MKVMKCKKCKLVERWKDVPNFRGSYQVSSIGRVKSLKRTVSRIRKKGNVIVHDALPVYEKVLSPIGILYPMVLLGRGNTRNIHALVALAFIGEKPPEKREVDHKDRDTYHNCYTNLRYVTRSENNLNSARSDNALPESKRRRGRNYPARGIIR